LIYNEPKEPDMMQNQIIEVAVALPVFNTYTYSIPGAMTGQVRPGQRVLVPFGRQKKTGYVLRFCEKPEGFKLRNIYDILDTSPLFPEELTPFFQWISDYYIYPLGEVIKCALPGGINVSDTVEIRLTEKGKKAIPGQIPGKADHKILTTLEDNTHTLKSLKRLLKKEITHSSINRLEKKGFLVKSKTLLKAKTVRKTEKHVTLNLPLKHITDVTKTAKKLIEAININGNMPMKELRQISSSATRIINKLADEKKVTLFDKKIYRDPFGQAVDRDKPPVLTQEQDQVANEVTDHFNDGFHPYTLAGVTGSGKTEVYMKIVTKACQTGKTSIILVPEIALISQTERRFRARFGEEIAVIHSGLTSGEKFDQWRKIAHGEKKIVIGARSAIFAPVQNIGVIIVDEEHDSSYKQDSSLRYNARDLALVRARMNDCPVVLGSATPSIQSWHNAESGKFAKLFLKNRVNQKPLPEISVIDLRKYRDTRGIRKFITEELISEIHITLEKNEQVLLFLNRRGFANFSVCSLCGESVKCRFCDVSLTYHKKSGAYKCHQCGFHAPAVSSCTTCGSDSIQHLGMGTEKCEEAVRQLFPDARVARLDNDTTKTKGSIIRILQKLKKRDIDILIGTQMVAKGHDFPNITLVGIICADMALNFPDFRSSETTFQILAQVAGRAGRGEKTGRVMMQTYNPDHFSITSAVKQDFLDFYNAEINHRKALGYPPYARMIQIRISGKNQAEARQAALDSGRILASAITESIIPQNSVMVLGPIQAALSKIADYYRWQILLKSISHSHMKKMVSVLLTHDDIKKLTGKIRINVDVDPVFML